MHVWVAWGTKLACEEAGVKFTCDFYQKKNASKGVSPNENYIILCFNSVIHVVMLTL